MSLNDPQWGKRPGREGPPDLDELWRNFNRKLDSLFGRRGGGDGERPPSPGRKFGGAGLLLLLVVAVWLGIALATTFLLQLVLANAAGYTWMIAPTAVAFVVLVWPDFGDTRRAVGPGGGPATTEVPQAAPSDAGLSGSAQGRE